MAALPSFAPRLPFFGALPLPPAPPLYLPGIGFKAVAEVVDLLAPPLTASEQVYLQSLTELGASLLGEFTRSFCCHSLESLWRQAALADDGAADLPPPPPLCPPPLLPRHQSQHPALVPDHATQVVSHVADRIVHPACVRVLQVAWGEGPLTPQGACTV